MEQSIDMFTPEQAGADHETSEYQQTVEEDTSETLEVSQISATPETPKRDTRWRQGYHLMPATGWLNDPNGLCQFRGVYHVFHQYSPAWPSPGSLRGWGHFSSVDLVHWENHGAAIMPELPEEMSGSYSGSAAVVPGAAQDGGDLLRLYYTGNVKHPGNYDYIHAGRDTNEIMIESVDGFTFGQKQIFMTNRDYPRFCSCNVRDPKVWCEDDRWWMLLGARDRSDRGMALRYHSDNGTTWSFDGIVCSAQPFGYMWECPDYIMLDTRNYFSFCSQGMEHFSCSNGMHDVSGYIPLDAGVTAAHADTLNAKHFHLWDYGFDFYAPQTFIDDQGRVLLIGWMGVPEAPYSSAPDNLSWCHCLTVPRTLTQGPGGVIAQLPVSELEDLHGAKRLLSSDAKPVTLRQHRADIEIEGITEGRLSLDGGAAILIVTDNVLYLAFDRAEQSLGGVGAGRTMRSAQLTERMHNLRILIDSSSIEAFADDGTVVMSTRWFPRSSRMSIAWVGEVQTAVVWTLKDVMDDTY